RFVISCTPPEVQQRIVLNKVRDTLPFLTFNNVVFDIYINGLPAASSAVLLDAAAMDLVGLKVEDLAGNGRKISITPKSDRHRAFELRPTFMPSFTDDTDIEEGHAVVENSSFHFCLASKPSPAENWDIKYLVNGSWIYESTGPIVEQDANRNTLYRNTATALVIADTVTELGAGAFGNWSNLTSVELGQSLKSIANSVFVNCSNLTEFICPNSLESLGYSALSNCNKIKLIEFGTSFISIGSSALVKCTSVETAVFRARVMPTIGNYAFGNGGTGSGPEPTAVYVPDDLFAEYENAIWHLARITTFLPLSTYESQNPD
ncbi:MAG: leucine-rich repeat domain-containing protein, partial [Acinetobacter sp.]